MGWIDVHWVNQEENVPVMGCGMWKAQKCEVVRDTDGRVAGWAWLNVGGYQGLSPRIIREKCLVPTPGKVLSHPRNWSTNQRLQVVLAVLSGEYPIRSTF